MFGLGSRKKLAKAEMALRQALAQHDDCLRELNTALSERDPPMRPARYCPGRTQRIPASARRSVEGN